MGAVFLLLLQAAAASPPARIDLTLPAATVGCDRTAGDDIVVCGARSERYRLRPLVRPGETSAVAKAETRLFGGAGIGAIETEAVQMPGGLQSNRLMARIKLPF